MPKIPKADRLSPKQLEKLITTARSRVQNDLNRIKEFERIKKEKDTKAKIIARGPERLYPVLEKSLAILATLVGDKSRPVINCVAIYEDSIYVTDSYKAVRIKLSEKELKSYGDFPLSTTLKKIVNTKPEYPILIPGKVLAQVFEQVGNSEISILNSVKILQDPKGVMVVTTNFEEEKITRVNKIEGTYPGKGEEGMDALFPKDTEKPLASVTVNVDYLLEVAKVLNRKIANPNNTVQISIYKDPKNGKDTPINTRIRPVVLTLGGDRKLSEQAEVGLVMPLTV